MRRIVHLSDLHFGRETPELLAPLLAAVREAEPDLVAVTGDLTQRARRAQFEAAAHFLDALPAPVLCVPGNHDIPLDRPDLRLLRPFARYRRHVSRDLAPVWQDPALMVQGLNTADPLAWQRGRVRRRHLRRACRAFPGSGRLNVLLAHHPFGQSPGSGKKLMRNARRTLETLADCDAHLVLSGHLHRWLAEPFVERKGGTRVLQVHVGTGISTRHRGQGNDFAVITLDRGQIGVTRMLADQGRFRRDAGFAFVRGDSGWRTSAAPAIPRES
ncbi:MAG: metallophosphoesterase family protein [Rhodosalinus sp.]